MAHEEHDGDLLVGSDGIFEYVVVKGDTLSGICTKLAKPLGYTHWAALRDANIEEIERVGRAKLLEAYNANKVSDLGYGRKVQPCGEHGHDPVANKNHFIENGVHYDGEEQPTIYEGTVLRLKEGPEKQQEEPKKEEEPPRKEAVTAVDTATNEISVGVFSQYPNPRIEVYEYQGGGISLYKAYDGAAEDASKQLLTYEFREGIDDVKGSFSFTVANEMEGGQTIFDRIKLRSIVKIYEGGKYPVFIGVIRRKSISGSMSGTGPQKAISFAGCSLMGLVADFTLSLDIKIMNVQSADKVSRDNTLGLMEAKSIADFLRITFNNYIELSIKNADNVLKMSDCETVQILKAVANITRDEQIAGIFTHGTSDNDIYYSIANALYSQGQNNIVEMWKHILPNPVYEIYGYCERGTGAMKIMVREAPFDVDDWAALRRTTIQPVSLKGYTLQQGDEEVYTVFNCWLEGSVMSRDFYTVVRAQTDGEYPVMAIANDKLKRYGYRPLEITFRGYDRSQNIKGDEDLTVRFKRLNERAQGWYAHLDEMFSGSITIVTNYEEMERNPRIGERVRFLGGEFYVTGASHRWNYGGNPTIDLTVTRGMMYNGDGTMAGVIERIGDGRREIG